MENLVKLKLLIPKKRQKLTKESLENHIYLLETQARNNNTSKTETNFKLKRILIYLDQHEDLLKELENSSSLSTKHSIQSLLSSTSIPSKKTQKIHSANSTKSSFKNARNTIEVILEKILISLNLKTKRQTNNTSPTLVKDTHCSYNSSKLINKYLTNPHEKYICP
ncbi:hypothetical protein BB558_000941 [Smittium angustum]|uniref:Uncharacterized protein n=1 Tax=Smittium angustum TaxID=133377 RepID=A0A2U1JD58_SMIAN|nr:hypothetical protein BB558_000941 [Smittium angustum]